MKITFEILRYDPSDGRSFVQEFCYQTEDAAATVATALNALNEQNWSGGDDHKMRPIRWECSCLQKKCGACAMVINGRPSLACDKRLVDCGERIRLEPLKKFPVVADLVVDRTVMYENLETLQLWLADDAETSAHSDQIAYDASRCLQCGCCLEVCPNFMSGKTFTGMAAAVPMTRLLVSQPPPQRSETAKRYRRHIYEGCGKSLACQNICPAGIDMEQLLIHSNAVAVWKRRNYMERKKKK